MNEEHRQKLLQVMAATLASTATKRIAGMIDTLPKMDSGDKMVVMLTTIQMMLEAAIATWADHDDVTAEEQLKAKLEYCRIFRSYIIEQHNDRLKGEKA